MFSSAEIMSWRYKWEELTCFPSNLEGGKKSVLALLGLEMQRCETVWLLGFRQINEQLGAGGRNPALKLGGGRSGLLRALYCGSVRLKATGSLLPLTTWFCEGLMGLF